MESSGDEISACRFSRKLSGIVLSKLRLTYANNGPESPVATAVRFQYTTGRSDSVVPVNRRPTYSEETMLTEDSEHTYRRFPSLRKEENNILLLLTWSSTYQGQTHEVLSDWIESEESLTLYRRLIEDVRLEQSSEEFALTLAALLCRERLLPYTMDDTAEPIGGSYLTDFDTIVNGQDISNRRTVFEEMILSLVRVLYTLNTNEEAARFLTEVLGKDASLLKLLDGVADQYCVRKLCRHEHNSAIEEVRHGLLECVQAMLKGDGNADTEWVVIP